MGNYFTNVQGRPEDVGVRMLRRRITYGQSNFNSALGLPIGALGLGAIPIRAYAIKNVAFSAGATLTLGNAANPGAGQAAVVDSFGTSASAAPQTAGVAVLASSNGSIGAELPADTIVYAYLGGTAPTAGDVTFVVEYIPAYPWSDNNGGQAS